MHQAAVLRRLADIGLAPLVHAVRHTVAGTWTVMDAVEPGTPLSAAAPDDRRAEDILATLHRLTEDHDGPPGLPDLVPWISRRLTDPPLDDMPPGAAPASERERARALARLDELGPPPTARLCHGDLSPGNALIGRERLWLVDPRGINGEPAYDIAVAALKACRNDPEPAGPAAAGLADATGADPERAAQWVPIAATASV